VLCWPFAIAILVLCSVTISIAEAHSCISGYASNACTTTGLSGWIIILTNGSYTVSTTTDASGKYQFCGLSPGAYTVREKIKSGWLGNPTQNVVLGVGSMTGVTFWNTPLLCISGYTLNACTTTALSGWIIILTNGSYTVSATTDASGKYQFCGLSPGTYTVLEKIKSGWLGNPTQNVVVGCDNKTGVTFWNTPLCISGYALNACTTTALSGWTVLLTNGSYTVSATTDASGKYQFCGLSPGAYTVREKIKSGWLGNPTQNVVLGSVSMTGVTFWNTPLRCISGYTLNSRSHLGLSGWIIILTNGSYTVSTTTDASGKYQFCGLSPGAYTVREKIKTGWLCGPTQNVVLSCDNRTGVDFWNNPLRRLGIYRPSTANNLTVGLAEKGEE
jgi:serine-aspartate repeat-containing protein C/D/E